VAEDNDRSELPDAEIAARVDRALQRMATTAPQSRKAKEKGGHPTSRLPTTKRKTKP
jgi:hypothetical protein